MALQCPSCGSKSQGQFHQVGQDTSYAGSWLKCIECGSVRVDPMPTGEDLKSFYESYYSRELLPVPPTVRASIRAMVEQLDWARTGRGNLLEFGYGEGLFLREAASAGWKCSGVEYAKDSIELGLEEGWDVVGGDLNDSELLGPFDAVVVIETLEHVLDPDALIAQCAERTRSGGVIFGTTPNALSLNARIFKSKWSVMAAPEHVVLFSPEGLSRLLRRHGFESISIRSHGINPHQIVGRIRPQREGAGRVESAYRLNESLQARKSGRILRATVNSFLEQTSLGDSLTFTARKA